MKSCDDKSGLSARALVGRLAPWTLAVVVLGLWAYAAWVHPLPYGQRVGQSFWQFMKEMGSFLPAMFILVGLFDVWVPRRIVERHVGRESRFLGMLWMIIFATLQAGPLYAAFPIAVALWRKGAAPRNVFIYLGAFAAMKIPMLTFEVTFLGWEFSLVRTAVTLPVFIGIGYLMERLLPKGFTLPETERPATGSPGRTPRTATAGEESNPSAPRHR